MPKRTNEFQQIVAHIYSKTAPMGAKVTESAILKEGDDGAEREIDILIESHIAGHEIKVAVECRDRSRDETLEWIDSLIGKTSRLKLNKVVAVSSSGFSPAAQRKAAAHNIDLLTAHDAATVDWASRLAHEAFRILTHHHLLLRAGAFTSDGRELSRTDIDPNGKVTHRDAVSEKLYPLVYHYFVTKIQKHAGEALDRKIAENWQNYIDDTTPRYAEFTASTAGAEVVIDGILYRIDHLVFGCGTIFNVQSSSAKSIVLGPNLVSQFSSKVGNRNFRVKIMTSKDGTGIDLDIVDQGSE